jgi:hypothetical protein
MDFFTASAPAQPEAKTPKASTPKSASSSVSSSGFGSVKSPAKAVPAQSGPDLLDFGAEIVGPKNGSLDDLLSAVGGAPPPSFVSPFQSSGASNLTDDLFGAAALSSGTNSGMSSNSIGFNGMGGMGQFGGMGGGGMQGMPMQMGNMQMGNMQMGNMQLGGVQGMGARSGLPVQQGMGAGMMGTGMSGGMVGTPGFGMGAAAAPASAFARVFYI